MPEMIHKTRDRDTEWHQSFVSNFDFIMPKKLIITIEAVSYDNPKEIVRIRQSVMNLCSTLRVHLQLPEIEVEPQNLEYRPHKWDCYSETRGLYFAWHWVGGGEDVLPASYPVWHSWRESDPRQKYYGK